MGRRLLYSFYIHFSWFLFLFLIWVILSVVTLPCIEIRPSYSLTLSYKIIQNCWNILHLLLSLSYKSWFMFFQKHSGTDSGQILRYILICPASSTKQMSYCIWFACGAQIISDNGKGDLFVCSEITSLINRAHCMQCSTCNIIKTATQVLHARMGKKSISYCKSATMFTRDWKNSSAGLEVWRHQIWLLPENMVICHQSFLHHIITKLSE